MESIRNGLRPVSESERQVLDTAMWVARGGTHPARWGYKPWSSPYSFQGLGVEGLKILSKARLYTGLAIITAVMSETDVELVAEYADIVQVGARGMENFSLLERLGTCGRPVLLKRGMTATLEYILRSVQFLVECGNSDVTLYKRRIGTFETATRNIFDVADVPVLKTVSRLPDPSHAAGVRVLVPILARATVVVGTDGHPQPEQGGKRRRPVTDL